jgi:hypothetical protein
VSTDRYLPQTLNIPGRSGGRGWNPYLA